MGKLKFISFIVLAILSSGCINDIVKPLTVNQNLEDFEVAWNQVNVTYPFLEYKKIDWDSIYTEYYSRAEAAQGDEFYGVLGDLLAELKDGHVHFQTEGGTIIYPYVPPRSLKDRKTFSLLVVLKYFDSDLLITGNKLFEYGILPGNIGYCYLPKFDQNKNFSSDYSVVIDYIKTTKGLIIDLRNNPGGNQLYVQALMADLVSEQMSFPVQFRLGVQESTLIIQPSKGHHYNNPLVVLINGASASAAELAPEILKQLPNVTAIGDTTSGSLGFLTDRKDSSNSYCQLPSGNLIVTPTGYTLDYDGRQIEWNGVAPDIYVEQTEKDIENGVDKQLEYAISYLEKNNSN